MLLRDNDAIRSLLEQTKGVQIPSIDAGKVRSTIGDVLARRPRGLPIWWDGSNRKTSPYRVYPDVDRKHINIIWLPCVEDEMRSVTQFLYPDAQPIQPTWTEQEGNAILLEVISPIYYSARMRKYLENKRYSLRYHDVPDLNILIPFVRHKLRTMMSEWLQVDATKTSIWYNKGVLTPIEQFGMFANSAHRTHKNGYELQSAGYVGQVIYSGIDTHVEDAAMWLQAANVWGLGSGTTWGWSTVWSRRFPW